MMGRQANFQVNNVVGEDVDRYPDSKLYGRHILGPMNIKCPFCPALMFLRENSNKNQKNPIFSMCCAKGKVKLPPILPLPAWYMKLITQETKIGKDFIEKIRSYNGSFAFTSLKANVIV